MTGPLGSVRGVTGEDVAAFLGRSGDTALTSTAETHLGIVSAMVYAYTRGSGFTEDDITLTMAPDLAAVVTTVTARLVVNPEQATRTQIDDFSQSHGSLKGFTLTELAVLNRYRKRAT